ncbi:MAG: hypothetical protein KGK33_00805, partial [Hyphomicrobiales bacterium]|nr:hypothetical protein [Hyphomicrobiales bacterium]
VMAFAQGRIGQHDRRRRAQALTQRDRERQAGKAAAGDHNVKSLVALGHEANTAPKADRAIVRMIISESRVSLFRYHALDGKSAYHPPRLPTRPYNAAAMTAEKGGMFTKT